MTTLLDINGRLKKKEKYKFKEKKSNWHPASIKEYNVPEFQIEESTADGAGKKHKDKLSKVLAFINSVKHIRSKTACTIMPISTTSKVYLTIWGTGRSITDAVRFMKKIGLISIENDTYRFNAPNRRENYAKTYRYYYENELKVLEYCKVRGIEPFKIENPIYKNKDRKRICGFNKKKVRFSSSLRLQKPTNLSKKEFEKELIYCLYENYRGLRFFIEKANEINKEYYEDCPEFHIRFQPNFTWSDGNKSVTGIGIRATNALSTMEKEERKERLKLYGFPLKKDINASVPRMTLSLNSGHWISESEDLYARIFRVLEPDGIFTNEIREAIKTLHMRAYFDTSEKQVAHHTWLAMDQNGINKEDVGAIMIALHKAIIEAEGNRLYGSDIFYVESCVYLMTLYDLLSSGHNVWQVYDCFYANGDEDQELFEELVADGVRINFNEFIKYWW